MLKNICKVHKREKNQWKVIDSADPVLAVLRHSLPKHCDKSAYATFFSPTSQCFIIKSFKHIAMSKELSGEHSYTHPSSTVVFSYICCLSQLFSHSWWFSGSWFILANILLNIRSMYSSILRISEHSLQLISKALRGIYFQVWEFLFLSYAVFLKNIYLFVLFIFSPAELSLVAQEGATFQLGWKAQGLLIAAASLVAEPGSRASGLLSSRHVGWDVIPHIICDLPQPGIEPVSSCITMRILNPWTTREAPLTLLSDQAELCISPSHCLLKWPLYTLKTLLFPPHHSPLPIFWALRTWGS